MISGSNQSSEFPSLLNNQQSSVDSFNWAEINLEETFRLIDLILPLEACLYNQIVPLSVAANCLTVAMVNPDDVSILDYVHSRIPSPYYSLKTKLIDSKTHQFIISCYLKSNPTAQQEESVNHDSVPTNLTQSEEQEVFDSTTDRFFDEGELSASENEYLSTQLTELNPQQLWQELLSRVLVGGIGRLYFEQHDHYGRILWTQNGVLQLSLEQLSVSVFQGVFNELKGLANLGAIPVKKSKKLEVQQYYQNERLLLLINLSPGKYGEEGTVQVLRGKALAFYQQRQMNQMGQEALKLAKQLERQLRQIFARSRINSAELYELPDLFEVQKKIKRQLELLDS